MSLETLMEHSPVGPSSGERWIFCPGSVAMTQHMPDTSSHFAAEGTFAHYITELARLEGNNAEHYAGRVSDDGAFSVDGEMVTAVQNFLDYCEQFEGEVFVEQRVTYDEWVEGGFGTSDHIAIDSRAKHCTVIDFKYGKGIQINAKGNTQGKLYALGVFQDWGDIYDIDKFTICISQPRIGHRDQWEITTADLLKWADNVVEPAGQRVREAIGYIESTDVVPDEYFRAGSWCQWCKIKGQCATRAAMIRDSVMVDVVDLDDEVVSAPRDTNLMSNDELGESMGILAQIRKWCNDVEEAVTALVQSGEHIASGEDDEGEVEFYKMVEGRSNRKWRDEEAAMAALKKAKLKIGEYAPRKLITAPQAEKLVGAKHKIFEPDKEGQTLIVKPQGKPVMVPGSDNRKVYQVVSDELEDLDDEDYLK